MSDVRDSGDPPQGPATSRMGATSARGIALLVGAVVLGIVLLRATEPPSSLADASEGPVQEGTTTAPSTTEEPPDDESTTSSSSSTTTEEPAEEDAALVLVANAANQAGVAGRLSGILETADFTVADPANATVDVSTSTVYFAPGFEAAAADVADLFDPHPAVAAMPDPPPVAAGDLSGANVILVAGPDLAG
ncbi:MAG: LytR cell envelope-related transcriptional attenuator [Acidimicrobiales bacterium]|nr:LytR cell envelope-related transcriptional attenuator [Acidimicrobiales bacterium]